MIICNPPSLPLSSPSLLLPPNPQSISLPSPPPGSLPNHFTHVTPNFQHRNTRRKTHLSKKGYFPNSFRFVSVLV